MNKRGMSPLVRREFAAVILVLMVLLAAHEVAAPYRPAVAGAPPTATAPADAAPTAAGPGQRPPDTSEGVHLFNNAYYPFDEEVTTPAARATMERNVRYAAEHYGVNIVLQYNVRAYPDLITTFHRYNPSTMVFMNETAFCCVHDVFDAWYADVDQNHDEWFLKDSSGERIGWAQGPGQYWFMDVGNPEYQAFWMARVLEFVTDMPPDQDGWDGVYIDTVFAARFAGLERNATYVTDAAYEQAAYDFLARIHDRFQAEGLPILINLWPALTVHSYTEWATLTEGIKIEHFVSTWSSGYLDPDTWERQVSGLEEIGRAGIIATVYPKFRDNSAQARIYGLASFLLGRQGTHDFFYYQFPNDFTFFPPLWFEEWEVPIGHPLGDRYQEQGVWQRDYSNGRVLVNPTAETYTVVLPAPFATLDGDIVSSVTLGANEAAILLLPSF